MSGLVKAIKRPLRRVAKGTVKRVIGALPPPASRLTGPLAKDGGKPVRDLNYRPWPKYPSDQLGDWMNSVAPRFKKIFLTGEEGLPQHLATEFAERWAEFCGAKHALLLPHGTDALRVALSAVFDHDGYDYAGEIIVPNLSFIASATVALDRRFSVALVDVEPDTLLIDPARVEEAIVPGKTRGIMAVHLFGQPADMRALRDIARRHDLKIIEDAAQAHGALHALGPAGSIGDAAGFSFQSSKNLSSGEGGALTTNDTPTFERAYGIHNVGRARVGGQRWGHDSLGWNIRPTEYVAALLLHRLKALPEQQKHRAARFETLRQALSSVSCVEPLKTHPDTKQHAAHMFVVRYKSSECGGMPLNDFQHAVFSEGIPLLQLYNQATLSQQPALQRFGVRHPDALNIKDTPVADRAVKEVLFLPQNVLLGSDDDMVEIAQAFAKVQSRAASRPVSAKIVLPSGGAAATPSEPAEPVTAKRAAMRFGIIGAGVMGAEHAATLKRNPDALLVGVADSSSEAAANVANRFNCRVFASPEAMIQSGEVDTIIIATPHRLHVDMAGKVLNVGLNVICEKPLAISVSEADKLIRIAASSKGRFATVFQNRFEPSYQAAKEILASGELGPIQRCMIVETFWRTASYFKGNSWRGTWRGEGGGVLINQAPHTLDRYSWLFGMPTSVTARCDTNLHKIEVEDTASAIFRHSNGAHGYIHVSTTEAAPASTVVVSCDRGRLTIENGRLTIESLKGSIREKAAEEVGMGFLGLEKREIAYSQAGSRALLDAYYSDFIRGVANGKKLMCPGEEGLNALELANAISLSSALGTTVALPLDRNAFDHWLASKIAPEAPVAAVGAR